MLARYHLKNILNAENFGLFYEVLSLKSLHFQGKHRSGGKHSKVRWKGMTASNALGEKISMFVIGNSASPGCFKHVRKLPCRNRSQKKAWMDGTPFEEWLHELDLKFEIQGRKVVMIVDNCPANYRTESYQFTIFATKYYFLYTADGSGGNHICFFIIFLFY